MNMKMCAGKSACTGIAIGRIFLWKKQESQVKRETVTDVSVEVERFERAKEVDFFSVGTNDLTQYTLAIDRQNPKLDYIYDTSHEAIMRLLQFIVKSGHKEGCWVGMCGELGADMELTETFLRMEFDELSVSPSNVLPLRAKIRSITLD